jgi:hypothetical protein
MDNALLLKEQTFRVRADAKYIPDTESLARVLVLAIKISAFLKEA